MLVSVMQSRRKITTDNPRLATNLLRDSEVGACRGYRNNQYLVDLSTKAEFRSRKPNHRHDVGQFAESV